MPRAGTVTEEQKEKYRANNKAWYAANKDRMAAERKKKRDTDPKYRAALNARNAENMKRYRTDGPRPSLTCSLSNARKRRPNSDLTVAQLMQMWEDQKGLCAVTGLKMTWGNGKNGGRVNAFSVSIDRINHRKDYTKKNVRLVCHAVNSFRGQMTDAAMVEMAKCIVRNAK